MNGGHNKKPWNNNKKQGEKNGLLENVTIAIKRGISANTVGS
jgi:hypothetical protein